MDTAIPSRGIVATLQRLLRAESGVSLIEFGLGLPLLMLVGAGGLEYVNLVLAHQKIERIAAATADAIARNTLAPSEKSFQDTFQAMSKMGRPFNIAGRGRVIITGLIGANSNGSIVNKIVWQRCGGALTSVASGIGSEWTSTNNYGDGPSITLPNNIVLLQNQMVIVSEVAYRYEPLINLSLARGLPANGLIRQRSLFVTRGQAFPSITPVQGFTPMKCS